MKVPKNTPLVVFLAFFSLTEGLQRAPRITTLLETVDSSLDHNATFICEVDSYPQADIIWTRNNYPIRYYDSRYVIQENGQMLIIPNVKDSDSGEYCCIANNGVGEAKSCGALQLKMKPQIKRHPTNMTLILESKAVLPCLSLGYPKPEISWIKEDDLIKANNRIAILESGSLKITNIKKEDAGQYRCVARNSFGIAFSRPVTIEVQAPAKILKVPKEKRVQIGSEVTLECNATGNPIPSITWLENGNTVILYFITYFQSFLILSHSLLFLLLALALQRKLIVLSSHLTGTESRAQDIHVKCQTANLKLPASTITGGLRSVNASLGATINRIQTTIIPQSADRATAIKFKPY
ncbi:muscle, skeletal receptor tyrosine-protein kinase isoform 3 precursor [Danio rerio]|uniref:Muscle, skeletal receptor tyrosine-protein kinase isoform 3 precursor n=1 Tax=Danio rerio TaxID=7955 RepID=Q8JFU3_DANRE|nr:muscle, skeletal receptor tyrosine-protein kinase isoform 3 precursor [Danio rerio]CAD43438.2 novel protein [Danio rerio]|eukprot:NP_956202.2 muscle, skeletal receptor tyrosine-protein kinase isoform 3 precursor [Danio rerio]